MAFVTKIFGILVHCDTIFVKVKVVGQNIQSFKTPEVPEYRGKTTR